MPSSGQRVGKGKRESKSKDKPDWFASKGETKHRKSSSDDTEDYEENISQSIGAEDLEFAQRSGKERAHKILAGVENKKYKRLDYSDLIEEFKDITENANEETRSELNQRIRENAPKDVEPGSVDEFFYGCTIDQPEVKERNCVPGCIRGYSLEGGCSIPVYEITDGEIVRLVDLPGNIAYLYIGLDDTLEDYDFRSIAKKIADQHGEPLDELFIYEIKPGSSEYKHIETIILRKKTKSYQRYKEDYDTYDENSEDTISKTKSVDDKQKCKKKKSCDTGYGGGAIFGFFIFFIFVIIIIAIFWIMRTPNDSKRLQHNNISNTPSNALAQHSAF